MKCEICAESNIGPEHEITEKHIRNRVLYDYALNRKQFSGNRKGVQVSCSVKSSFLSIVDNVDAKIKISVKPNEEIKFYFTIKNDSKKEDIVVIFIQMSHNKLNFVMNDHGLPFGCKPVTIKPKKTLQREVSISFKSADVGQYEMPIIFSFRKPALNEGILIMRDMVVFVEEQQRVHEKIVSPYAQKEVRAQKLFKTTLVEHSDDMFRIPKNYKSFYANGLKDKEDATKEEKDLCKDLREIFATGVTEDNYVQFFHNLLWYEETIVRINLKKYNMSKVPLVRQGDAYTLIVPGLAEKRPSLMLGDMLFVKPHNNDEAMFEAVITNMEENVVNLKGFHPEFERHFESKAMFDIRFFISRMSLERMHRAVQAAVRGSPDQRRVFPERTSKRPAPQRIDNFYNVGIEKNPEQRSAVEHIVGGSAGSAPYLLHGPPGTGKTVTIVEAILQLVGKNPANRIMVCTDSNMAADHVATMIVKYADMFEEDKLLLRANSKFRVWETLPKCLKTYSNGTNRDNFEPVSIEDFKSYNIVVTTLSHAAKFAKDFRVKRMNRPITHLFIDEAAQASEPACLIPICGLLAPGGALTLAGDPLQLGPVVISHHARNLGLGLSLMQRLMSTCEVYSAERNDPDYTLMLRNNFRSDPALLHIPNELFYKGQLRALAEPDPISSVDLLGQNKHSHAIVFHGVLSKEQKMGKSPSFYNNMELEIVQMYIKLLIQKHKVQPEDIGVVTPYIRQVYNIKNWLDKKTPWGGRVEVGTVEAYQGKEKRVIVVSTVRANCSLLAHDAKYQLGFLVDDRRFNVALTRAKAKAIVIGNPLCLEKDAKWRAYMQRCRELGTYCGYDAEKDRDQLATKHILDTITPILQQLKINKKQ